MFARDKRIGPYTYVYLVENVREEGRTKQRIIANLGRKEVVVAHGSLLTHRWRERDSNPRCPSPRAKAWAPCRLASRHGWMLMVCARRAPILALLDSVAPAK